MDSAYGKPLPQPQTQQNGKILISKDLRLAYNIVDILQIQKVLTCQYTDDNMQALNNFSNLN